MVAARKKYTEGLAMNKSSLFGLVLLVVAVLSYFFYTKTEEVNVRGERISTQDQAIPTAIPTTLAPIPGQEATTTMAAPTTQATNISVLAIDLHHDSDFSETAIRAGRTVVLVLKEGGTQPDEPVRLNPIGSFEILDSLDENNDGSLDLHDPLYLRLHVLHFLSGGNRKELLPLLSVGVRGILLNIPTRFAPQGTPVTSPDQVGSVVMSDGSKRQIRVVPLDIGYLQ